jgi:hypothetical protein
LAVLHLSYFQQPLALASLWPGLHQQKSQELELQMFVLQTNFNELLKKIIFKLWKVKKFKKLELGWVWTLNWCWEVLTYWNQWVRVGYMYTPLITVMFKNQRIRSKNLPWTVDSFMRTISVFWKIWKTWDWKFSWFWKYLRTRTRSCKILEIKKTRTRPFWTLNPKPWTGGGFVNKIREPPKTALTLNPKPNPKP